MSELAGKRVVVVGLGASGVAAARLCLRARRARRRRPTARPRGALSGEARALEAQGATLVARRARRRRGSARPTSSSSRPGVPPLPELDAARSAGRARVGRGRARRAVDDVPGARSSRSAARTARARRRRSSARCSRPPAGASSSGGNLGEPLADARERAFDVVVLEVSSFQMERVDRFRPRVAVLLNVTDDHLDRYASFDDYADAKGNAFVGQTADDCAVVPAGDATCAREARRGKGRVVTFGPGGDVDVTADAVVDRRSGERYPRARRGAHRRPQRAQRRRGDRVRRAAGRRHRDASARVLRAFRGLPHRMALVAEIGGVRFYDDSKGTNVGAAVTALEGLVEPKRGPHRRRARQGRQLRAARRARSATRAARAVRPRRGGRRHRGARSATRCRCAAQRTMDEAVRIAAVPRRAGRRRAPLAGVLELRHVPRLQAPRRRVRPRGAGAARRARRRPDDRQHCATCAGPSRRSSRPRSTRSRAPRARRGPVDPVLAAIVVALIGFGVVMVYSASAVQATVQYHDPQFFLKRQVGLRRVARSSLHLASRAASTTTASTSSRTRSSCVVGVLLLAVRRRLRSLGRRRGALALARPGAHPARRDGQARRSSSGSPTRSRRRPSA